jgi:hypothetical protein
MPQPSERIRRLKSAYGVAEPVPTLRIFEPTHDAATLDPEGQRCGRAGHVDGNDRAVRLPQEAVARRVIAVLANDLTALVDAKGERKGPAARHVESSEGAVRLAEKGVPDACRVVVSPTICRRSLIAAAEVLLAPGTSIILIRPVGWRRKPWKLLNSSVQDPTICPRRLIPAASVRTALGTSMTVNVP